MKGPPRPSQLPKERKGDKYARLKEMRKRKREEKEKGLAASQGQPDGAEKEAEPSPGRIKIRRVGSEEHGTARLDSMDSPVKTGQEGQQRQRPGDREEKAGSRLEMAHKSASPMWGAAHGLDAVGHAYTGSDRRAAKIERKQQKRARKEERKEKKRLEKLEKKEKRSERASEETAKLEKKEKRREGPSEETSPKESKPKPRKLRQTARQLIYEREQLPIFRYREQICRDLQHNDVMLLVGETGSGKSTQVPQYLVAEKWCRKRRGRAPASPSSQPVGYLSGGDAGSDAKLASRGERIPIGGCIAITEPRRVAAISLARRVAKETGSIVGTDNSMVGYSVRFDNSTSSHTRIKYMTDGVLLQEMLADPWLTKYSAVVVDEVHERGVNADLLLGFLRNIVSGSKSGRGGVPLKVIVMSATADMESLKGYFHEGLAEKEKGEKEEKKEKKKAKKQQTEQPLEETEKSEQQSSLLNEVAVCHIEGKQHPVEVIYSPEPVSDFVDAALKTISQIHYKEPLPGDILVFLTGQETVESLENLVNDYVATMDPSLPKLQALPLFSALPQAAQQQVFEPAAPGVRKVILSTNIAETSVTVPGVRYVVDCGKAKMKQFRPRLGLESLLVKPISKSSAIQRKGRAGREGPGKCYRLYTEEDYLTLENTSSPEILRCDVSHPILTLKARGVDDIMNFPFLSAPPRESLEKALLQLYNIQALDDNGSISSTGHKIAKLPLRPALGRVLLAAAQRGDGCVRDVVDIISCFSVENIFLSSSSPDQKEAEEAARRDVYRREGDHLTMLAAVRSYGAEKSDRKRWAKQHMVSHRAMQAVMDVRQQLLQLCQQLKLLDPKLTIPSKATAADDDGNHTGNNGNSNSIDQDRTEAILKSFLAGFATQTARLSADGSYRTVSGNQTVAIHPASVLYGRKVEAIMYDEYVFTTRSYARGVSAVQPNWIAEVLG